MNPKNQTDPTDRSDLTDPSNITHQGTPKPMLTHCKKTVLPALAGLLLAATPAGFAKDAAETAAKPAAPAATTTVELANPMREKPGYAFLTSDLTQRLVTKYDADGKPFWVYNQVAPIDTWPMADGTVLMAYLPSPLTQNKGGVRLVDADKKTVFDYPFDDEIMSVQPLPSGNFLINECHKGLITELTRKGEKVRSFPIVTKPRGHQTCRQVRLTEKGTLIAAECYSHKLREYTLEGKFLRESDLRFVYYPQPLPGDHVLCACWNHPEAQVVELDADRKPVWGFKAADLPKSMNVTHIAGVERLANGNTLVSVSCKAGPGAVARAQLFEITPDKKIVWQMIDPKSASWMTEVRLLTPEHLKAAAP